MNKVLKVIAVILLIGGIGYIAYSLLFFNEVKNDDTEIIKEEKKNGKKTKTSSLPVKVTKIKRGDLPLRLRISAIADVWEKATIKTEATGKIEKFPVKIGDKVSKGQLLLKIEDTNKKLDVEKAKVNERKMMAQYLVNEEFVYSETKLSEKEKEKIKKLKKKYLNALNEYRRGALAESVYERIRDEYNEAMINTGSFREEIRKANDGLSDAVFQLKQAELELKKTAIKAPFPGIITDIKVSKGQRINAGVETLTLVNLDSLYLKGFALESEVRNLRKGIKVRINFDAFPDKVFYGEIRTISPQVDSTNKTIAVFVKVDNKDHLLYPGMRAELDIEYKVFKDVMIVPRKAIVHRGDRPLVFVVKGKIAVWSYVELGQKNDEEQIVNKFDGDVKVGDLVVIQGQVTLAHQSRVKIVK
jgi:RND family efflux transporter MFP subunit